MPLVRYHAGKMAPAGKCTQTLLGVKERGSRSSGHFQRGLAATIPLLRKAARRGRVVKVGKGSQRAPGGPVSCARRKEKLTSLKECGIGNLDRTGSNEPG